MKNKQKSNIEPIEKLIKKPVSSMPNLHFPEYDKEEMGETLNELIERVNLMWDNRK